MQKYLSLDRTEKVGYTIVKLTREGKNMKQDFAHYNYVSITNLRKMEKFITNMLEKELKVNVIVHINSDTDVVRMGEGDTVEITLNGIPLVSRRNL